MTIQSNYNTHIILFLTVVVLFLPSSINGKIFTEEIAFVNIILVAYLFVIGSLNSFSKEGILLSTLGMSVLFLSTLTSSLSYIAFGAIPQYLVIFTLFSINLRKDIFSSKYIIYVFYCISCIIILFAYLFIFDFQQILQINESYYQAISQELFTSMIIWSKKPVTFFASHSIAAYVYFAFLFTHLKLFNYSPSSLSRIFTILFILAYMGLLILLVSNTGYILFVGSIFILVIYFMRFYTKQTIPILLLLCIIFVVEIYDYIPAIIEMVNHIFLSHSNGLLSRYTSGGRLDNTYHYIIENIFHPIGFTFDSSKISIGDNFIAEYIIRGGVFFYIIVLVSLYLFLKRNLLNQKNIKYFMFFFLLSDLGYPMLVYYRTVAILILLISIWNYSDLEKRRSI